MSTYLPAAVMLRLALVTAIVAVMLPAVANAATPAFSVHKNGTAQTVTANTPTKLTWSTEVIDTNANFATNRFTPTVAGNYLIVVSVQCAQPGACVPAIYKNGSLYAASRITNHTFADQSPQASAIVSMNGTTDYVEAFATSTGNSIAGVATQTYFSGSQIDGAGSGGSSQWIDGSGGAIYYNGGNVGIGAASPGRTLDVSGNASTGNQFRLSFPTGYTDFRSYDGSGAGVDSILDIDPIGDATSDAYIRLFRNANTSGSVSLDVLRGNNSTATNSRVSGNGDSFLNALTGNVGIGTASPAAKLDVAGNIVASGSLTNGGFDFILGSADQTTRGNSGNSRALVKYTGNILGINWGGDFAGGTAIYASGNTANLFVSAVGGGNVGIGTTSPTAKLDIGDAGNLRLTGHNTEEAYMDLGSARTGSGYAYIDLIGDTTYTDYGLRIIRNNGGQNTSSEIAHRGTGALNLRTSEAAPVTILTANAERLRIDVAGNVGIGTTAPSHILHISGQGRSTVSTWATSSDARVKEDIHPITGGLDAVEKLRPVTFRYTKEYQNGNPALGGLRRGFIAQEVEAVLPDAVTRSVEKVGAREISDFRVLGNSDFVPLLVSAVKELRAANDNLKTDNDKLRAELRETINIQDAEMESLRLEIEALKSNR